MGVLSQKAASFLLNSFMTPPKTLPMSYLEETLRCVFEQKNGEDEIILVDNASVDRSIDIVKKKFSEVKIIQLKKNLGPGFARNAGFVSASHDLILFLDNDVCLTNNCKEQLIAELKKYLDDELDIQLGGFDAQFLLEFFNGLSALVQVVLYGNHIRGVIFKLVIL